MNNKEIYHQYCSKTVLPLYLQGEWLDAAVQNTGDWDVVFSFNDKQEIQGFWVYVHKQQLLWKKVTMPPFIPYMGPRLIYPDNLNEYQKISFENKVLTDLIEKLPAFASVQFKWTAGYQNWLPFYWKGYRQQTAYTYLIKDTSNEEIIFKNFKNSIQRQIRKARQQLSVRNTNDLQGVLSMFKISMRNQPDYKVDEALLKQLHQVALRKKQVEILEAIDADNRVLGALYLVFDKEEMLYLYGGYDDAFNDSGAMALLFWTALQSAHQKGVRFNFEGSMLAGVERFFRSFGGELAPVFTIEKKGFLYKIIETLGR